MREILLIDDDQELCSLLQEYLEPEGFAVSICHEGEAGLKMMACRNFSLVILDIGLPDISGFEVLTEIRRLHTLPVIILTARSELVDCVTGLEMGADDYKTKPFTPRELLARIRALLRRNVRAETRLDLEGKIFSFSDLTIDDRNRRVFLRGERVSLTNAEFGSLKLLLIARGEVISREELSQKALHKELTPYDRSVDVHISNIRSKLGPLEDGEQRIVSIRGAGYVYTCPTGELLVLDDGSGNDHSESAA